MTRKEPTPDPEPELAANELKKLGEQQAHQAKVLAQSANDEYMVRFSNAFESLHMVIWRGRTTRQEMTTR